MDRKLLLYEEVSDIRTLDFIMCVLYNGLGLLYSASLATMKSFHTFYFLTTNCVFIVYFEQVVTQRLMMWVMNIRRVFRTLLIIIYETLCAIWYHLYCLKNVKTTTARVLLLVKLHAEACNFTKSNTPPWVFFAFFRSWNLYQIAQSVSYMFGRALNTSLDIY